MKKVTALVLAALLVFALAACSGSEQEAYALYTEAAGRLVSAESFAADTDLAVIFSHDGQDTRVSLSGVVKGAARDVDDVDVSAALSVKRGRATIGVNGYFTDGWSYVSMMGTRMKVKTGVAGALPESAVKDAAVETVAGGSIVTFTLDGAALDGIMGTRLPGMRSIGLADGADIHYSDAAVEAFIGEDGALKTVAANVPFTLVVDGEAVQGSAAVTLEVTQMGGITVALPDDLDSYREITT